MDFEPGPIDLLDRDMIESYVAPSIDGQLQSDMLDAVAPVQGMTAALDGKVQDLTSTAATSSSPTDDTELDGGADSFYALVDGGLGQPDTSVAASVDGANDKTNDLNAATADSPNPEDVLNPPPPGGGGLSNTPPPPPPTSS